MEVNHENLLLVARRQEYSNYSVPLYKAALSGDWGAAVKIYQVHNTCFTEKITKQGDTALHVAAVARQTDFVLKLVPYLTQSQSLSLPNNIGNTALCLAAASGTVAIAEAMVKADPKLPMIRGNAGLTPLNMAALLGHRDMVIYLLECTTSHLIWKELVSLFISTINTDLYDIALGLVKQYPDLAMARDDQTRETPLHVLAKKSQRRESRPNLWSSRFNNICKDDKVLETKIELVKYLWERVLTQPQEDVSELMADPWRMLFVAVEVGNVEFVTTLIRRYPDLIWKLDERHRTIFHVAVRFRQESIFKLIFEIGAIKDLLATYSDLETHDNMLHLAALLPSSDRLNCISGAALQMQREMLWFKVVENIVQPQLTEARNKDGNTPKVLFTEQHKELRKEGEEWMRKTAGSCSVVATLIAGVAFGAALKAPGSESDLLSRSSWHWLFAVSDSLSLISSTASILMFLSIMTSGYAEKDFLKSLPRKLMIGLTLLFISIASMMVAFTTTFRIVFNHSLLWAVIAGLSCIPILLFGLQEFPLLWEVLQSTVASDFIFKPPHQLFSSP